LISLINRQSWRVAEKIGITVGRRRRTRICGTTSIGWIE